MNPAKTIKRPKASLPRIERAMVQVAARISQHVEADGRSPHVEVFERLEVERQEILRENEAQDRAADFLRKHSGQT